MGRDSFHYIRLVLFRQVSLDIAPNTEWEGVTMPGFMVQL